MDVIRDIRNRVESAGARMVFADGLNFENNATGKLMFTQMAAFAEFEKELIRERTMIGRRRRAEEGQQPSRARSPYGYHVVTRDDLVRGLYPPATLGMYQIVEEQARWVRSIFQQYAGGASLTKIARQLQENQVPAPRGGKYWRRCTVQRILRNPVYKGTPVFGRYQAMTDERRAERGCKVSYVVVADESRRVYLQGPALVDEETFARCQALLTEGRPKRAGNPLKVYALSGLIRCPLCGKRMPGKQVKRTFKTKDAIHFDYFYRCPDSCPSSNAAGIVCNPMCYRAESLEALTCRAVKTLAERPEYVASAITAYRQGEVEQTMRAEIEQLKRDLQELEAKEKAVIQAQIEGIMAGASASIYAGILRELSREREELQARLEPLEKRCRSRAKKGASEEARLLAEAMADVDEALYSEYVTHAERRDLLSRIVQDITPHEEKGELGVLVRFKSPLIVRGRDKPYQIVSMISTLARGTVTVRPS